MDDTTIELFVKTQIGREIFNKYSVRFKQRNNMEPDFLEGSESKYGGVPKDLIRAMQDVIPGLKILRQIPNAQVPLHKSNMWLQYLGKYPEENNAKNFSMYSLFFVHSPFVFQ